MSFTARELAECANKELARRRQAAPQAVMMRKIKQSDADRQIDMMQAIYRILISLPDEYLAKQDR